MRELIQISEDVKRACYLLSFLLFFISARTQNTGGLQFLLKFDQQTIFKDSLYINSKNDSFRFHTIKFYISDIQTKFEKNKIFKEPIRYHLLDFENQESLFIPFQKVPHKERKEIRFNIGIDSTTNVSGAFGGDLDPTKGMYWTWQNGYINIKLEGFCNRCPTSNNEFQFHIGGYMAPYHTLQSIHWIPIADDILNIEINLADFMTQVEDFSIHTVMSPQFSAVKLSRLFATCFSIR